MITIKTGSYSKKEVFTLFQLFNKTLSEFSAEYCREDLECEICEHKHICEALRSSTNYLKEKV